MADNVLLNPGTGGDTVAADDVAGVKYQVVKLAVGADGAASLVANANPIPISDAGGSITVDGTVAVSGTVAVTDNAGSLTVDNAGTFAVQASLSAAIPAGTNNIGDVDVLTVPADPFGANADAASATGSISAKLRFIASTGIPITGTVTVASHAVTNAGTFVTQENGAALTALQLIDNLVLAEDAAHASGDPGVMMLAVRNDAGTALAGTTGDYIPLSTDSSGALRVVGSSGTTQYTEDGASAGGESLCLMGAVRRDTAASSSGTDGDYSTLNTDANGNLRVALSAGGISGIADDAAFTVGTSEVLPVGFMADETATDSVNEGDIGAARITLDRKVIVTPYAHAAAGGVTPYFNLDCDESEDDIKTSAGKLYWIHVMNLHASSTRYLKFYNATAANVTVGTTTPVLSFPVPANVAGFTVHFGDAGVQFDTAISVAATTGFANNDTGAPGANEVILNAGYL